MFSHLTRAERSGSIFSRIIGLISAGHLKWEDRPIWFDAYAAHPPQNEPNWDIIMPKREEALPKIFYHEDIDRAKRLLESRNEEPKQSAPIDGPSSRSVAAPPAVCSSPARSSPLPQRFPEDTKKGNSA
uniref:Ribosomal protein S23 mitochondrial conserved domain-containing protein n=1 Tax=Globodera rostochiensis TaxID=31243 RepID=A0A914HYB5_GLORO